MTQTNYPESGLCQNVRSLLSEYQENALSARQTWEVEKHLATCPDCATESRQLQATVQLLREAPRRDTGDDFMARLHARLDEAAETSAPRPTWRQAAQDWLAGTRALLTPRRMAPALGLSLAAATLTGIVVFNRPAATTSLSLPVGASSAAHSAAVAASEPLEKNVALAASNPFDDPVAAHLEAHSALNAMNDAGVSTDAD